MILFGRKSRIRHSLTFVVFGLLKMHGFNVALEVIGVSDGIIEVKMKHFEKFLLRSFSIKDFFRGDALLEHAK